MAIVCAIVLVPVAFAAYVVIGAQAGWPEFEVTNIVLGFLELAFFSPVWAPVAAAAGYGFAWLVRGAAHLRSPRRRE